MNRTTLGLFGILVTLLILGGSHVAYASSAQNLSGYAWSDNIGWISFNCTNTSSCSSVDYGVNAHPSTGIFSGYAWSDNIGWVSFNASSVSGCPTGSCRPTINNTTGAVTGWARALAGGTSQSGGWDGWIRLSGSWSPSVSFSGTAASGYSWGSDVVGWVSWSGVVRAQGLLPDLIAGSATPTTAGSATTLSATVSNIGTASTGSNFSNFSNFFNFFQVATAAGGVGTITDLAATTMTALAVGVSNTATSPSYTSPSAGTTYSVRACADKSSSGNAGTITESNEGNNCGNWTNITVSILVPTADLDADPSIIDTGQSTRLRWWSSINALSCVGVGFNTGFARSGNVSVSPSTTLSYQVTCYSGTNGTGTPSPVRTATVVVNSPNSSLSASPTRVRANANPPTTITITSIASQVNSCTLRRNGAFWKTLTEDVSRNVNNVSTTTIATRTVYTLTCATNGTPPSVKSVTVNVIPIFEEF